MGSILPNDAELMDAYGVWQTVLLANLVELYGVIEMQTATVAVAWRRAEHWRILTYWLNQSSVMASLAEPFALAEPFPAGVLRD